MKIYSDDGKVFSSVEECKAYETELVMKKQQEEAEQKAKEEQEKKLKQYRSTRLKEINEDISRIAKKIKDYENETGYKIVYGYDFPSQKTIVKDTLNNSIDFAWENLIDDIFRAIHKK